MFFKTPFQGSLRPSVSCPKDDSRASLFNSLLGILFLYFIPQPLETSLNCFALIGIKFLSILIIWTKLKKKNSPIMVKNQGWVALKSMLFCVRTVLLRSRLTWDQGKILEFPWNQCCFLYWTRNVPEPSFYNYLSCTESCRHIMRKTHNHPHRLSGTYFRITQG